MPQQTYGRLSLNIPENFCDTTTVTLVNRSEENFGGLPSLNPINIGDSMITVSRRARLDPPVPLVLYAEHQIEILRATHENCQIVNQRPLNTDTKQNAYKFDVVINQAGTSVSQSYVFFDNSTKIVVICGSSSGSQSRQRNMREYISKLSDSLAL